MTRVPPEYRKPSISPYNKTPAAQYTTPRSSSTSIDYAELSPAYVVRVGNGDTAITGDPRVYGRVYIGTNGRGIIYGDGQ